MGYMTAFGRCAACRRPFSFNPELVPSVRIDGHQEPICRECIEAANIEREKRGLAKAEILPGAYDPQPEGGFE